MSTTSTMICTRCNKASGDVDKCSTCGTRLSTLKSQQRRGWTALGAGAFLVVFMSAVWIWVDRLLIGGDYQRDATTASFTGKINVAFALVVVAGVFGVINGRLMVQSGRRNRVLLFGLVIAFVSALFVACSASNMYHGS
jgi:MFS family permease